ncbi:MAG: hypothetical protein IPO81_26480 [Kouleothrix sp.]|nr:hypothetical protein [Kouleothrix sp.]
MIIPKKLLRPAATHCESDSTTPAWDLYLDGELVASGYPSEVAARMELDLAAWYALFGEAPLVSDIPITKEALDLALAVFNRLFTTEKIQAKGRLALEKIIRAEIHTSRPTAAFVCWHRAAAASKHPTPSRRIGRFMTMRPTA